MANPHDHADDLDNEAVHHEESDVNIRAIFGFGAGLFLVAVVVHVAIYLLFVYFTGRAAAASATRAYPLAAGQENRLPPEPRLQVNPRQDLRDLRAEEDEQLTSYHWVDRNNNIVRIPIDEAMKLTLQRGLPSRPQPPPAQGGQPAPNQRQ
jgi:hypothetical protein